MDEHLITRGQAKTNHFQRRCPAERCMLQGLGSSDNTDIFEYDQELGARIRHFTQGIAHFNGSNIELFRQFATHRIEVRLVILNLAAWKLP